MKHRRPVNVVLAICLFVGVLVVFILPGIIGEQGTALKNACINNLRLIDAAKQTWASEHHKSGGDMPTWADLNPYLTRGLKFDANPALTCPDGGTYVLGAVTNFPTCSISGHALPK